MRDLPAMKKHKIIMLIAVSIYLITPKLLLIDYNNQSLWGNHEISDFAALIIQDSLLSLCVLVYLIFTLKTVSTKKFVTCFAVTTLILIVLLIDCRVRQLWLKPIDFSLIEYSYTNATALLSGHEIFLNHEAGWGMTFRKSVFFILLTHLILWMALAFVLFKNKIDNSFIDRKVKITIAGAIILLVISVVSPSYSYQLETNIFTQPLVNLFKPSPDKDQIKMEASLFDQKVVPFREAISSNERFIFKELKPFKNIIVVMLESWRWKGIKVDEDPSVVPNLYKLAKEGLLSKSYVSMPHSSKSLFTVLTGRHPYPGIEMNESIERKTDSFFWALREKHNIQTYCLSSAYLHFENMNSLLSATGIETQLQSSDLSPAESSSEIQSSFGGSDEILAEHVAEYISKNASSPFGLLLLPIIPHYPYDYPGKNNNDDGINSYLKSIAYADKLLGNMMDNFRKSKLLEDTLFVFVGDHGESFGEHGTLIHNNSMYEEEVTVPLIFWSSDGRLQHEKTLISHQIDIAPTILDIFDVKDSALKVQGSSILRKNHNNIIYGTSFFDDVGQMLVSGTKKYIYFNSSDKLLLFDLELDPNELNPSELKGSSKTKIVDKLNSFKSYQKLQFSEQ